MEIKVFTDGNEVYRVIAGENTAEDTSDFDEGESVRRQPYAYASGRSRHEGIDTARRPYRFCKLQTRALVQHEPDMAADTAV